MALAQTFNSSNQNFSRPKWTDEGEMVILREIYFNGQKPKFEAADRMLKRNKKQTNQAR